MQEAQHILLVEDDSVDALTVKRAFKEVGICNTLDLVSNGEEALEYLAKNEHGAPALVLLDLNMPRMNGIEFLKAVKQDRALQNIPVVVLTTSKGDQDRLESFRNGASGYMVKSLDYAEFKNMIKAIDGYWTLSERAY